MRLHYRALSRTVTVVPRASPGSASSKAESKKFRVWRSDINSSSAWERAACASLRGHGSPPGQQGENCSQQQRKTPHKRPMSLPAMQFTLAQAVVVYSDQTCSQFQKSGGKAVSFVPRICSEWLISAACAVVRHRTKSRLIGKAALAGFRMGSGGRVTADHECQHWTIRVLLAKIADLFVNPVRRYCIRRANHYQRLGRIERFLDALSQGCGSRQIITVTKDWTYFVMTEFTSSQCAAAQGLRYPVGFQFVMQTGSFAAVLV